MLTLYANGLRPFFKIQIQNKKCAALKHLQHFLFVSYLILTSFPN